MSLWFQNRPGVSSPVQNVRHKNMSRCTKTGFCIALLVAQAGALSAQQQYVLTWRGTGYTRNAAGNITAIRASEKDFIQKVATDNGLNPNDLAFVYRVDARDTAVVRKADGGFVADVIQLQYNYVDVPNASGTTVMRQAMLNDEAHDNPIGSAFGTETARYDGNGNLKTFSFRGSFQYALPEDTMVFSGTFTTGKALNDMSQQGG